MTVYRPDSGLQPRVRSEYFPCALNQLLDAQSLMQLEADNVVRLLGLDDLLSRVGRPIRVGSSAMGVMVRRDIDITVVCDRLDEMTLEAFADIGARLMQKTEYVASVRFRNDTRHWNAEPEKYPDGLYLGLAVRMPDSTPWTVDIWLIDQPDKQPDLAHLKTLMPRLSDAHRAIILQIKHDLATPDQSTTKIPSALVYEAVVDHGVKTTSELAEWHRKLNS